MPAPGWYPDVRGRHELRYWDGTVWTSKVRDGGQPDRDAGSGEVGAYASLNVLAAASLLLVLFSFVLGWMGVQPFLWLAVCVAGVVCGAVGWHQISASHGTQTGKGLIVGAWVICVIVLLMVVVGWVLMLLFLEKIWHTPE